MKKLLFILLMFPASLWSQNYNITIKLDKPSDDILYIGQHFRDELVVLDSAKRQGNSYVFKGRRKWDTSIYALIHQDKKKSFSDFTIDGSQKFSLHFDSTLNPEGVSVKGCPANSAMFAFLARDSWARSQANDINKRKKSSDAAVKSQAEKDFDKLSDEMVNYQNQMMDKYRHFFFFQLQKMFESPDVPDSIQDKACYYRTHFWDGVDFNDPRLKRTPGFFNKMNYFFFGILYHADADTICRHADLLISRFENDSSMMRYFLDFIMPKYYRSTKNIGWDQVWCYLVHRFYEPNRSGFAYPGDISSKVKQAQFLEKSLIGAMGAELFMADTNQSPNANDWISSHRFPNKYVILWFWDPDCHHCQEQTATLISLYDSLSRSGNKPFEVYAVGYESDVAKWKKYVRQHNLPFVNVGGNNVNIDYQEAYNVHGAPTMIILNADRQIIMNKTIPTSSILPFISEYERLHPEQANRPPSRWQQIGASLWGIEGYNGLSKPRTPIVHDEGAHPTTH